MSNGRIDVLTYIAGITPNRSHPIGPLAARDYLANC